MDMTAYFTALGVAIALVTAYAFIAKSSRTPTWLCDLMYYGIFGLSFLVLLGDELFLFQLIPLGVRRVIQSSANWRLLLVGVLFYPATFIMLGHAARDECNKFAKALSPVILPVIDGVRVSGEDLRFTGSYSGRPVSVMVAPSGFETPAYYVVTMHVPERGRQWSVRWERSELRASARGRWKIKGVDDSVKQRLIATGVVDALAAWTADSRQSSPAEFGTLVWSYNPACSADRGGALKYRSPLHGRRKGSLTSEQFRARLDLLARLHQMTAEAV